MLPRRTARTDTLIVTIGDPIAPEHVAGMCAGVRGAAQRCDPQVIVCDVEQVRRPTAATVDLLARVALLARREHRRMALARASAELTDLLALVGLDGVPGLRLEPERQAEGGEDPTHIQEEGDPADPVA